MVVTTVRVPRSLRTSSPGPPSRRCRMAVKLVCATVNVNDSRALIT